LFTERPDSLGFYCDDTVESTQEVKTEKPFPGDHLATDDMFILRASFLGNYFM